MNGWTNQQTWLIMQYLLGDVTITLSYHQPFNQSIYSPSMTSLKSGFTAVFVFITSAEGIMFLLRSVCLFVCPSDNWKNCERILTKFLGRLGHGPGTKGINFGDNPDHRPDPGVRSLKSGFSGLLKKYLVDLDQSCIASLHCKSHSAILLCWRSAEVCALWVLLVEYWD